jgi:putative chitinase
MKKIDRKGFYQAVRVHFRHLDQGQVDGFEAILNGWEARGGGDTRHLAYMLATAWHETATTMQPVHELGGPKYLAKYDTGKLAKALGNTSEADGDGAMYCGRGYVQLTGKANYTKAGKATGKPLVKQPDLAMDPSVAAEVMFSGMAEGWFTGKKLSDYFDADTCDADGARRIINGTDCAGKIAGYWDVFIEAIRFV